MIFYFSGDPVNDPPERIIGEEATIMITFWHDIRDNPGWESRRRTLKPHERLRLVSEARQAKQRGEPEPDTSRTIQIKVTRGPQ